MHTKHTITLLTAAIALLSGCQPTPSAKPKTDVSTAAIESTFSLNPHDFRQSIDGKQTDLFILKNAQGMKVALTNYGARVVGILVPDRDGAFGDVITGFNTLQDYIDCPEPFHGPIVGRVGNRIAKGTFTLDGTTYSLPINNGPNQLHGGVKGFHNQVWEVLNATETSIDLRHLSQDGEMGYPGNLDVTVRFELSDSNELILSYHATADQKTVVNLTWHPFFNLAGEGHTINDHILTIPANHYTPVDATLIPLGQNEPVTGTPFDFRKPKAIGRDLDQQQNNLQLQHGAGYDHNWALNRPADNSLALAARIEEPTSGRVLEIFTQEPGIQFYGGNFFDGNTTGKNGQAHQFRGALALEPQKFPDAPNQPAFPSIVLDKGETYTTKSVYTFSVNQ